MNLKKEQRKFQRLLHGDIYECKKGHHRITNLKVENRDLLADFYNILNRWKNYFCRLLNVHGINYVRQTEMHTAEPLVPEAGSFEIGVATEKLQNVIRQVFMKFWQN
jgi:hypothetical protein